MKKLTSLLVVLACATILFASGSRDTAKTSSDGKIHLSAYFQIDPANAQYEGHNQVIAAFQEKYPNIVLDIEYANGEAFHQKFQSMAASGSMPDIFTCYGGARSYYLTQAGLVLDLREDFLTDEVMSKYSSATWSVQGSNGEFWMIPPSMAVCHTVYANRAILDKLGLDFPTTYEEWKSQVPIIRAAGYYPVSMGNKDPWVVNSWLLSLLIDRLGGPDWLLDAQSGKASFTEMPMVRSLEIIKEMTDIGMFSPGVNQMSNTEADQEFYQGKSVYLIDAGWRTSGMDKDLAVSFKENIELHVFPEIEGEVRHETSTATTSEGFALSRKLKGTEKAEAAWTFITFYNGEEGAAIRARYGEVPTYKLDLDKIEMKMMQERYAEFQASHDMGFVFDAIMGAEGVSVLNQDIQAMMLGNGNPEKIAQSYENFVSRNERN